WVLLQRLVGRQHVVVGGDDADVAGMAATQCRLVLAGGGKAVGEVAAAQRKPRGRAGWRLRTRLVHPPQVVAAGVAAAFDDARGDALDGGVQAHHGLQCTCTGAVAASRTAATGGRAFFAPDPSARCSTSRLSPVITRYSARVRSRRAAVRLMRGYGACAGSGCGSTRQASAGPSGSSASTSCGAPGNSDATCASPPMPSSTASNGSG